MITSVLVTRPDPQGSHLCATLRAKGFECVHLPTLVIGPPSNIVRVEQALENLAKQQWLILISPQAVYALEAFCIKNGLIISDSVNLAAVGAGTATLLRGLTHREVHFPPTDWSAEGLLALPVFQNVAQQKIMMLQGNAGRDVLLRTFIERKAYVEVVEVYQRLLPEMDMEPYQKLLQNHAFNVIVSTSFSGVKNLKTLFGTMHWERLRQLPVIVVSNRIKALAFELGYKTIWVAKNASDEAISTVLEEKRESLWQMSK
ncbi:MAG: uroporphyrinogen-III synthase [Gammaproteobacteria bacterium]|nr:uroporphyrinogen-III synthase [Gammaproteobacteria bacterium]